MTEQSISLERLEETINVFGSFDENIRIIEGEMEVSVVSRDSMLKVSGENAENVMYAVKAIEALMSLSSRGGHQRAERALYHPAGPQRQREPDQPAGGGTCCASPPRGGPSRPRPWDRRSMWRPSRRTWSPWASAPPAPARPIWRWRRRWPPSGPRRSTASSSPAPQWRRVSGWASCLGDLQSKVDPYLRPPVRRPVRHAGRGDLQQVSGAGNIEVAPLAYMRGRTLDDSFIILDEAQNTSREQMKMFLTRLGFGSKIVITGDITQIDLPADKVSGLREAMRVLKGVEDISICRLTESDVVRHVLVQRIIKAYEEDEERRGPKKDRRGRP